MGLREPGILQRSAIQPETVMSLHSLPVTVTPKATPNFAPIADICEGATAPTLNTTSPNGVTGTWNPATISNTARDSNVFTLTASHRDTESDPELCTDS